MAQQQQQQQVPAPMPDCIKFAELSTFDGSHTRYKTFIQELKLFLQGYHVTEDQTKIIIALSYMKEGPASNGDTSSSTMHLQPTILVLGLCSRILSKPVSRTRS